MFRNTTVFVDSVVLYVHAGTGFGILESVHNCLAEISKKFVFWAAKRFVFMVTCNERNLTKVIPDGLEPKHVTG